MITVTLTSCGRFDLLERTLRSFFALNKYPIERFIIHEDSGNQTEADRIKGMFPQVEFMVSNRIGLSASWDKLLAHVDTDLVFTCEDDWLFTGNRYFMTESVKLLERCPEFHHVWIRNRSNHLHPLGNSKSIHGITVREVLPWKGTGWNGFSMNPGLRRMSDLRKFFPNGLAEFGDEIVCARHTKQFNYKAISLANGACKHIGDYRHTQDFKV